MKIFKVVTAVVASVALSLGTVATVNAAGTTLKIGAIQTPVNLAADQGEYGNKVWYYQAVYDTLLRKNERGTLLPGLATKWSYNSAQTVLTLTLRSGVKFTDGGAVNPAAVVANINANRDSKGPNAGYLSKVSKATARGTNTVVLTLSESNPSLLGYLADTAGLIASPKTIGKETAKTRPIGSGPYILDTAKTVAGSKYVYRANPNYWDAANRKYSALEISVYDNNQTALINALRSGAVQAGNVQNSTSAAILVNNVGFKSSKAYLDAAGIYFSGRAGKADSCIKDVNVRRAINTVFDRPGMVQALEAGTARATTQFFPSYMAGYDRALNSKYAFNETTAKALMAASAFPQGCKITMPVAVGAFGEALYALIDSQLAKLKIEVTRDAAGSAFISNIFAGKYDAYYIPLERSADPWTLLNFAVAENATFNNDKFTTPAMAKLIGDYRTATDAKRPAILKSINKILVDDAWFSILYEKQANFVYKGMTVKAPQSGNIIPFLYNIK